MKTDTEVTFKLGRVVAEGESLLHRNRRLRNVKVSVGRPVQIESGEWFCPHKVVGIGEDVVLGAYGVSSLQALLLSVEMIAVRLRSYAPSFSLATFGSSLLDLGEKEKKERRRRKPENRSRRRAT